MGMDFNVDVNVKTNGKEAIDALERQLNKLKSETVKVDVQLAGDGADFAKYFSSIQKQAQSAGKGIGISLQQGIKSVKFNGNLDDFTKAQITSMNRIKDNANKISKDVANTLNNSTKREVEQASNQIAKQYETQMKNTTKQFDSIYSKFQSNQSKLKDLKSTISNNSSLLGSSGYDKITSQIKQAEQATQRFNAELQKGKNANLDNLKSDLKEIDTLTQKSTKEYQKLTSISSERDQQNLLNKLKKYEQDNARAIKAGQSTWNSIINDASGGNITTGQMQDIESRFKSFNLQMQAAGKTGKSFWQEIGRGFKQIAQFAGTYGMIQRIPQEIGKMYQETVKVDTAMTNLYKVTDETSSTYDKFLKNSGTTAKSLGRDISSYIEQTANWSKLGYSLQEASQLSKVSSIYANVGEVGDQTAVSDIVTTLKAFNMSADQGMSVVDKLNKLGNEFATSSKDLGEGLSNSASALALGGMDINKSLALLTGGAEITQSASELGNALKVGQMRVMGMKGKLDELGEESEGIESVSKIQTHILNLTKGQVNIMNDADPTKFKDYYDILKGVSDVYNSLTQTEQADLLETLFGKQRGNQGAALIQAFQSGQIQKAYEAALNAEGSAMQEQNRWLDSIEAKQQKLQASFQAFSTTAINSDFSKGLLDFGSGSLDIFTNLIDKVGTFKGLIASIGGGFLAKNGLGKRNADLYKIKQNYRRFINVEKFLASNKNKPYSYNY